MNGLRIISHGGADTLFNTELYLVPDKGIGIFVSYSGGEGATAAVGLSKTFFDRYYPLKDVDLPLSTGELQDSVNKYSGFYQFTRRNHSDIDKFYSFMSQISIAVLDNRLTIGSGPEQLVYAPVETNLFQEVGGTSQIGFRTDTSGEVTHLLLDFLPSMPLERAPLINQSKFWFTLIGISSFLFITVLLGFVYRKREIKVMPKEQKWFIRLSLVTSVWALLSLVVTFVVVLNMDLLDRLSRITPELSIYLVMPIILITLTVAMIISSFFIWKNSYWTLLKRVHYTLVALSALITCLFYYHWNLIGWQFG
ncbi:hypothetical protein [Paenibacillus sp. L3-i20]|uniref:hypothetical protein n=1 Tax=Paenibacillus sp. L3-i20 TaxID=2905833 RepID=UPI0020BDF4BA|nr:hypothetical protein [Paenibacillus sp. L3-i20]